MLTQQPAFSLTGLFAGNARAIAESLSSRDSFPQGPAIGLRLLAFYLSHGRRGMTPSKRKKIEKAKEILSACVKRELQASL